MRPTLDEGREGDERAKAKGERLTDGGARSEADSDTETDDEPPDADVMEEALE